LAPSYEKRSSIVSRCDLLMKYLGYLLLILLVAAAATLADAVSSPPPGTVLPVQLSTTLGSRLNPGQQIHASVMQNVLLPAGKLPERSKLIGHVVSVAPDQIVIQFDSLHVEHQVIPVLVSLRAIASPLEVEDAQLPSTGPDRGTSSASWVTDQIGGEVAYRGSDLMDASTAVGKTLIDGSTVAPLEASSRGCSASDTAQALWVFSSGACGVYGYPELTIAHAGRTAPVGQIALRFNGRKPLVRSGSGLLLRVVSEPRNP
jgi:hypothetical protein